MYIIKKAIAMLKSGRKSLDLIPRCIKNWEIAGATLPENINPINMPIKDVNPLRNPLKNPLIKKYAMITIPA